MLRYSSIYWYIIDFF